MTTTDEGRTGRLEALTREILSMCGRATGLESTYLTLIHWEANEQEILFSRNVGETDIPEGLRVDWSDTLCRRALETGPSYTDDVPNVFPDSDAARDLGLQTYLSVPVVPANGGEPLGTLCGASRSRVAVSEDAQSMMASLASMVALQLDLESARADLGRSNAELEAMANTDALTGVGNRRRLEAELERLKVGDPDIEVSVLVLDMDRFKRINDTHGHLAGDDAIVHVANQLRSVARRGDLVVRLGGDEFVLVLPRTSVFGVVQVAERIAAAVAGRPATTVAGPVPVRVSLGTATGPARDIDHLLAAADEDLYAAKQHRA